MTRVQRKKKFMKFEAQNVYNSLRDYGMLKGVKGSNDGSDLLCRLLTPPRC